MPLPSADLRTNRGTWAVPCEAIPALAAVLLDLWPREVYDPDFHGQRLETYYLDTPRFHLRKARGLKERYLTLRVRCYRSSIPRETYALSAKTEESKFRVEIAPGQAESIINDNDFSVVAKLLPPELLARLMELTGINPITVVSKIHCRRYAVEDDHDRLTLDTCVRTDTGKVIPYGGVLEFKSTQADAPPGRLQALKLRPIKLSKFLWSTDT